MKKEKKPQNSPAPLLFETGGVVFFLIQKHQKVSLTLDFVVSASPFCMDISPLFLSPFALLILGPPLDSWLVWGPGGYCWQRGGKEMEKVDSGNGRRWLVG